MGMTPITSGTWSICQIQALIAGDAHNIELGVQSIGESAASMDHISMLPLVAAQ